jgi:hypothetical protein
LDTHVRVKRCDRPASGSGAGCGSATEAGNKGTAPVVFPSRKCRLRKAGFSEDFEKLHHFCVNCEMQNFFNNFYVPIKMSYSYKKLLPFLAFLLCTPVLLYAQGAPEIGVFGGVSTYSGDLTPNSITFKQSHPAFGFLIRKSIYKGFGLRLGVSFGKISGADSLASDSSTRLRNLSFTSNVTDVHLLAEYNFFDYKVTGFTPYVFVGISVFYFDPYARDTSGMKVYLPPLSTEGEGLTSYPDRKPYNLTQISIPFGVGLKYLISPGINLGVEFRINKTFTDYLDDISTSYVDKNKLLAERGPTAVDYAFRSDEVPGHKADLYPAEGAARGSAKYKDWYYFTGLTLTFDLNGGNGLFGKALKQLRCPGM